MTPNRYPGLHLVRSDRIADSEKALRDAAKASEAVAVQMGFVLNSAHRVRDGYL